MNAERVFLHDISSPLTTVRLSVENVIAMLDDRKPEEVDDCLKMLNSCIAQLERVAGMIKLRSEFLSEKGGK